jgi:hypothetical protein
MRSFLAIGLKKITVCLTKMVRLRKNFHPVLHYIYTLSITPTTLSPSVQTSNRCGVLAVASLVVMFSLKFR